MNSRASPALIGPAGSIGGRAAPIPYKRWQLAALLLHPLAFGLRVCKLGNFSLWGDEAWTAAMATLPLAESYRLVLGDGVHPPLYYLIMRLMALMGHTEWILRWPSVLFGTLTVALVYRLGQAIWNSRIAFLAALLVTLHPYAIWYSREARQYSLAILLSAWVMFAFVRLAQEQTKSRWLAFVIASSLSYLTHYFLLLLSLVQFVYLVISLRKHYPWFRRWAAAQIAAGVPVMVWITLYLMLPERNLGIGWIQRPELGAVFATLWRLAYNAPLSPPWTWLGWATMFILGYMFLRHRPASWSSGRLLTGLWLVLPILSVWLISQRRPFYSHRFFVICLPATVLILAAGLNSIKSALSRYALGLVLITLSLWTVVQLYTPKYAKEDWRQVGEWLYSEGEPGDVIAMPDWKMPFPLRYYYAGEVPVEITIDYWGGYTALNEWAKDYRRLWTVFYGRPEEQPLLRDPESFSVCERRDVPGLTIFICPVISKERTLAW